MDKTRIPKVAYFYWASLKPLSYLRYLTFKSFRYYNPDFKIILCCPKTLTKNQVWSTNEHKIEVICKDWLPEVQKLVDEVRIIDFETVGFKNDAAEVHKSDYLRIWLLYNFGGYYFDTDILFCRPIDFEDEFFIKYGEQIVIGALAAIYHSENYKKLNEVVLENYNPLEYQSLGTHLYTKYLTDVKYLPLDTFYIYPLKKVFKLFHEEGDIQVTHGLHWFGGVNPYESQFPRDYQKSTAVWTLYRKYA